MVLLFADLIGVDLIGDFVGVRDGVREGVRVGVFCRLLMLFWRGLEADLRGVLSIDLFGVLSRFEVFSLSLSLALVGVFCFVVVPEGDFSREFCAARFFLKACPKRER